MYICLIISILCVPLISVDTENLIFIISLMIVQFSSDVFRFGRRSTSLNSHNVLQREIFDKHTIS